MHAQIGIQGFGQYDAIRREMIRLQAEFEEAAQTYPCLGHQLVSPLDGPLTPNRWSAFSAANSKRDGDWQEWDHHPGGESCSRFYGNKESLNAFTRMADAGMNVLARLSKLADAPNVILPSKFVLKPPSCKKYYGWLQLLHETARCYSTPFLHAEPGYWDCTGQSNGQEDSEVASLDGLSIPAHPFYEELRYDLFESSAEAVRLWLDPVQAICFGIHVTDTPIYLPPEPEMNGPSMPDSFWLNGKKYDGFSPAAWRLLECLWGQVWVSMDDAIRHVYGIGASEGAIISTQKRLSRELDAKSCPAEIHRKQGGFYLEVFNQE